MIHRSALPGFRIPHPDHAMHNRPYIPEFGTALTLPQATALVKRYGGEVTAMLRQTERDLRAAGHTHIRGIYQSEPHVLADGRHGWQEFSSTILGFVSVECQEAAFAWVAIKIHWATDRLFRMDHWALLAMDPTMPEPDRTIEIEQRAKMAERRLR